MTELRIRPLGADDAGFMERMMLFAGFPSDVEPPPDARSAVHVRWFLDGWGARPGDVGVAAEDEAERLLGAAWARVLDEPLLRDDAGGPVPELAIAVEPGARGAGVGGALLDALVRAAAAAGHAELSLRVAARNPAAGLYARRGFEPAGEWSGMLVMRRRCG